MGQIFRDKIEMTDLNDLKHSNVSELKEYIQNNECQWESISNVLKCKLYAILISCFWELKEYSKIIEFYESKYTEINRFITDQSKNVIYDKLVLAYIHLDKNSKALEISKIKVHEMCKSKFSEDYIDLYSFRDFTPFAKKDIESKKLTFAYPKTFNDPLDTILYKWLDRRIDECSEDDIKQSQLYFKKAIDHLKVRCFVRPKIDSQNDDYLVGKPEICYIHPLMWAHYANKHHGMCLKYRISKQFFNQNSNSDTLLIGGAMNYRETIDLNDNISLKDALYAKSSIWRYENEYRLIYLNTDSNSDYLELQLDDNSTILEVYLGVNCSDYDKEYIIRQFRSSEVKIYKMEVDASDTRLLNPIQIA